MMLPQTSLASLCLGFTLLVSIVGCSSVTTVPLRDSARPLPPRDASTVDVYRARPRGRHYDEIALLEVDADPSDDPVRTLRRLRDRAGALGCDGLVLLSERDRLGRGRGERATCIVYTREGSERRRRRHW